MSAPKEAKALSPAWLFVVLLEHAYFVFEGQQTLPCLFTFCGTKTFRPSFIMKQRIFLNMW